MNDRPTCPPTSPLVEFPRLASELGLRRLLLKLESALPISHTFKDRGALAAVDCAIRRGASAVLAASCGNMGVAVSGACARLGIPAWIVLSAEAPATTQAMIAAFASRVWAAEGRFDELDALLHRVTEQHPSVACINTTLNATFRSGFRSLMAELLGQLHPARRYAVIVPTADGTLLSACAEEYAARRGRAEMPRVRFVLAQPAECAPLVDAFLTGQPLREWSGGQTDVLPLAVRRPFLHGPAALRALADTGGTAVAVPETDIPRHADLLARGAGLYSDLVGGVLLGAVRAIAASGWLDEDELPVGIYTGNGLIESRRAVDPRPPREPSSLMSIASEILDGLRESDGRSRT